MKIKGKKTYIVALGGLLAALGGALSGDFSTAEAISLGVQAVLAATLRAGISKDTGANG